jgi:hypothetical protein
MRRIHELRPRGPSAGDLKEDRLALGHREVIHIRGLGPEATRRQGLQLRLLELVPESTYRVPEITVLGPVVWMQMGKVSRSGRIRSG